MLLSSTTRFDLDTFSFRPFASTNNAPARYGELALDPRDPDKELTYFAFENSEAADRNGMPLLLAAGETYDGTTGTIDILLNAFGMAESPATVRPNESFGIKLTALDVDISADELQLVIGSVSAEDDQALMRNKLNDQDDVISGSIFDDVIRSHGGDDVILGFAGNDLIDGGAGEDTAIFASNASTMTVRLISGSKEIEIEDRSEQVAQTRSTAKDQLIDIEFLRFGYDGPNLSGAPELQAAFEADDFNEVFDLSLIDDATKLDEDELEQLAEIYIAYFDRAPDAAGLLFWADAFANGTSLDEIANLLSTSDEARELFPVGSETSNVVTQAYETTLGRAPDADGLAFWVELLDSGALKQGEFIVALLEGARSGPSPDASAELIAQKQADQKFLDDKIDIGIDFALRFGMSDIDDAREVMELFDGSVESKAAALQAGFEDYRAALATDGTGEFLIQLTGFVGPGSSDLI